MYWSRRFRERLCQSRGPPLTHSMQRPQFLRIRVETLCLKIHITKHAFLSQNPPLRQTRNHIFDPWNILLKNIDDLSPHCLLQDLAFITRNILASSIIFVSATSFSLLEGKLTACNFHLQTTTVRVNTPLKWMRQQAREHHFLQV